MADLSPVTPEEIAEYEKTASPSAAGAINPVRDLSADEMVDLSAKDSNFDPVAEFRRNQDLWQDPSIVQKVADVHNRIKQRGFQLSDIPGPAKVASNVVDIAKGLGKQVWNYANALVGVPLASAMGSVTGAADQPGFNEELKKEGQRRVAENIAGSESAVFGLSNQAKKAAGKIGRVTGISKPLDQYTPEEKVQDLFSAVGTGQTEEEITKGKGGFLTPIGANVVNDLEQSGKPVRPEEVQQLAAGDPISFWAYGKTFQGISKAVPAAVSELGGKAVNYASEKAVQATGAALRTTGNLTALGTDALKKIAPAVGAIGGLTKGGPVGAFVGYEAGKRIIAPALKVAGKIERRAAAAGSEVAKAEIASPVAQVVRDVAESTPGAIAEVGKGAAFDLGLAAVTSESPQDTQSVGIGTLFGLAGGARRMGGRVLSGQLVAPRPWGSDKAVPSSGALPTLDAMHSEAIQSAPPAVQARVNAIREFVKGVSPDTDVFLGKDAAAVQSALEASGVSPEQAKTFSQQEGFFTANINGRRAVVMRNVDSAPHEAFHAIQDVLGEEANQRVDQIVKDAYSSQWDAEGERYANRIKPGGDWRETILDSTGEGLAYAKEKLSAKVANEVNSQTGAEPPAGFVQERVKGELGKLMDDAVQRNPHVDPNEISQHIWRDVLSADEARQVADTYLARELAAENFDVLFKHGLTPGNHLLQRLARVVGGLVSELGGEPLAGRESQIGGIEPKTPVIEAVKNVIPKPQNVPVERPSVTPSIPAEHKAAAEAREFANLAGTKSEKEILGSVAEAIAQKAGVKINYLSAPGEPAAATTSNREARREVIETYRDMPPAARALWEKNFFPDRVEKRNKGFQILGWSPEVFASNAHKLAKSLEAAKATALSPYEVKGGTFTEEGWKQLFEDTQKFVRNQMAGQTGAGEPLVVPKSVTEKGLYAPASKTSEAVPLDQNRADFINTLFNFRLPDTARAQKGKLPLNLAGQEISEATKSGRVEVPVRPRGAYTGEFAGREIKEVNPLRQQIEQAMLDAKLPMPSLVEAQQRLNLENIKEVQITPEQPQFRGNTLTLTAGFQPETAKGKELAEKGFEFKAGGFRGTREVTVLKDGKKIAEISSAMLDPKKPTTAEVSMIYVDESFQKQGIGEALYRELAAALQQDGVTELTGRAVGEAPLKARAKAFGDFPKVENIKPIGDTTVADVSSKISPTAKFSSEDAKKNPEEVAKSVAKMTPEEFKAWAREHGQFTTTAHETGLNAPSQEFVDFLDAAREAFKVKARDLIGTGEDANVDKGLILSGQSQFFREAWEAATGEGSAGFHFRTTNPKYTPKFPLKKVENSVDNGPQIAHTGEEMKAQLQPKKDFKLKPAKGGFSKAWILPDGTPVQLGGQWHHEFINASPELQSKYGLDKTDNTEENRVTALKKGFLRVNYNQNNGQITFEGREKNWPKLRESVRNFVERNAGDIDGIQVYLFDDAVNKITQNDFVKTFELDDEEKAAHVPFLDLGEKRATGDASDRLFEKAVASQFQPKAVRDVAEDYAKEAGFDYQPTGRLVPVNEDTAKTLADFYQEAKHNPEDAEVKKSYDALAKETVAQYKAITRAGYKLEPFTGEGEPYDSSDAMVQDVTKNHHLYFLPTSGNFEGTKDNHMLQPSGINDLLVNDTFRAVHDFFGHAKEGLQFGPKGEFNAWRVHSELYSPEAQGALAAETLAQNSWVNFGKHLRNAEGSLPKRGEPGYVAAPDRPFAEQKNIVIPEEILNKVRAQFQPELGNTDPNEWIKLGASLPKPSASWKGYWVDREGNAIEGNHYWVGSDILKLEPKGSEDPGYYEDTVKVYNEMYKRGYIRVEAFGKEGKTSVEWMTTAPRVTPAQQKWLKQIKEDWEVDDIKRLRSDYQDLGDAPTQFQPRRGDEDLFGNKSPAFTSQEIAKMDREELMDFFPEAYVPAKVKQPVPSEITESPLFKQAGTEEKAVEAFADKMVEFAKANQDKSIYKSGRDWYEKFTPELKKEFGDRADLMAELLAATSPQTNVETNFAYALDALESWKAGRFDKIIKKFNQGLEMLDNDTWQGWYAKELKAGNVPEAPKEPTPAAFLEHWIFTHNLKPTQSNGKLFGQHSLPVLQVFARRWLDSNKGPKTANFVKNLLGQGDEATIDLWADRTMRRLGYSSQPRWRILSRHVAPVSDKDFAFSQKAFRRAAEKLGMKPSALQGALWFAEKQLWADNGWSRLDLGDFSKEMTKLPLLRAGIQHRLTASKLAGKIKPAEQLGIVEAR